MKNSSSTTRRRRSASRISSFSTRIITTHPLFRNDNNICIYCKKAGHWVSDCPNIPRTIEANVLLLEAWSQS
ncbi:unnamed protein product [Rhizophagus irregularis]|nr:unnamed protein product [Rhizophagus irregularis]